MGFFSDLKDDLSQAVNELLPEEKPNPASADGKTSEDKEAPKPGNGIITSEELSDMLDKVEAMSAETDIFGSERTETSEEAVLPEMPEPDPVSETVSAVGGEEADAGLLSVMEEDVQTDVLPETEEVGAALQTEELQFEMPELILDEPEMQTAEAAGQTWDDGAASQEILPDLSDMTAAEEVTAEMPGDGEGEDKEQPGSFEDASQDGLTEETASQMDLTEETASQIGLTEETAAQTDLTEEITAQTDLSEEIIKDLREEVQESMSEEVLQEATDVNEDGQEQKGEVEKMDMPKVATDETAVVTEGMSIIGDITSGGSLELLGSVTGNIEVLGKLNITGSVQGNSKAAEIYAEGARINGEISSQGSVKIGQSSVIIGNIFASSAVIAGAVKGDIDVQGPVVLDTSAIVMGNIKSKSVQINNGAVIEGMCSQCYAEVNPSSFFEEIKKKKGK